MNLGTVKFFSYSVTVGVFCMGSALANPAGKAAVTTCLLVPSLEVNVGTPVDGVLDVVNVDRGDVVRKGQLLARLNTDVEAAAVAHAAAKADFGQRKYGRNEDLYRKKLISSQELDEIQTERELAKLEQKERQEQLRLRNVVSPVNGVVVDRYRNRGDLVKQEKIFRLAQLDPLYVETIVSADVFGRVAVGQAKEVDLPLLGQKVTAKVSSVDRVIDPASGTFRVRLSLPNPRYEIPSGLRCNVTF